jgi:HlyD family secretion protein
LRAGLALFLVVVLGGAAWLSLAKLAGAVVAGGAVNVAGMPKTIEHLDGGIVASVAVEVGDTVEAGDVLVVLDDTMLRANLEIYRNRLREGVARQARLRAERDGADAVAFDARLLASLDISPDEEVEAGQVKLFEARRATRRGQVAQLEEQVAQHRSQLSGVDGTQASQREQQALLLTEYGSMKTLSDQGYAPRNRVTGLEREVQGVTGRLAELDAEKARIRQAMSETAIEILQVEREFQQSVLAELREVDAEIVDLVQQIGATRDQLGRIEIRSPVEGLVHDLSVFTVGGVVAPGEPIMQVIPRHERLIFEVRVEPQFIDALYPGQDAKLRFPTLDQARTPELSATVAVVSPSSLLDEATGMTFYQVRLTVPDEELAKMKGQPLLPGMPVEAYVQTGERSALSWLLKPLSDQAARAMRED